MKIVCPQCQCQFPLSAGLLDADAKRFGVAMAATDPAIARAMTSYLSLHKPAKSALRLSKATRIVEEINTLVVSGVVRRNGVSRPATTAMWIQAIDAMLDNRGKLRLPLNGHGYLLEILAGLADKADAARERAHEADLKAGRHLGPSPAASSNADPVEQSRRYLLRERLRRIETDQQLGIIDDRVAAEQKTAARKEFGVHA